MLQKYNFLLSQNESQCKISAFFSKKQIFITKNEKNLLFSALGIGRAMVFGTNAELVNPCKAGRSQGVDVSRYSKGMQSPTGGSCSHRQV